MKQTNLRGLSVLFALALLAAPVLAAEEAADLAADGADKKPYVIHDEVFVEEEAPEPGSSTIAAKLPLALDETPVSVGEVDAETLTRTGADVLGDALETVAGVNVQSGNGIFDVFSLRGLDSSSNGLILVDGAREPQSAFYQLYNVERVEVWKGPASILYGGLAMGGAVNLVRKQPTVGDFVRLGVEGGSFSTLKTTLDANRLAESGRWGVRLNGQWFESDLYRDDLRSESLGFSPSFFFRAGEKTTVHVSLEFLDTEATPDAGLPLAVDFFTGETTLPEGLDRRESYNSSLAVSDQQVSRFQVDVEHRFSDDLLLRNKTYVRSFEWLSNSTILNGVFPDPSTGTPLVLRSQLRLDDEQTFFGNQLEALWRVEAGAVAHNFLFGLEVSSFGDEFDFGFAELLPVTLFGPQDVTLGEPFFFPTLATDATSTVLAAYAVDQVRISDKVQLLFGARFDDVDFEDDLNGFSSSDSQVSPMVGAVFQPGERLSIYLNAGQAFAPPSTFVVGDNRDPEESEQLELGFRTSSAGGKLRASLALFQLDRTNVAIPDQTGVTRQLGETRSEGLELELSAELRPGLDLGLTYAYTDAELTRFTEIGFVLDPATFQVVPTVLDFSGNAVPWVPESIFSLWLTQRFDNGFGLGGGGRFVDDQFIAASNAFAVDSHTLFDAVLWWQRDDWRIQLNLDNLGDEETFTRAFNSTSVIPAPGFSASLGLLYDF